MLNGEGNFFRQLTLKGTENSTPNNGIEMVIERMGKIWFYFRERIKKFRAREDLSFENPFKNYLNLIYTLRQFKLKIKKFLCFIKKYFEFFPGITLSKNLIYIPGLIDESEESKNPFNISSYCYPSPSK